MTIDDLPSFFREAAARLCLDVENTTGVSYTIPYLVHSKCSVYKYSHLFRTGERWT